MSKKILTRLTVLSALLLIGLVILVSKDTVSRLLGTGVVHPFSQLKSASVSKVQLDSPDGRQTIYHKQGVWYVKKGTMEYRADKQRVESLLNAMQMFAAGEIASTNKRKHAALGIGTQKISVEQGKTSYVLYVGKAAGEAGSYVRVNDEDTVYIAPGFDSVFTPIDYRDLSINPIQSEDAVTRIHETGEGEELSLEKSKDGWKLGFVLLKKDRVDFWLNDIKTLQMVEMISPSDVASLYLPETLTLALTESGKETVLHFYRKDSDLYYLVIDKASIAYSVKATYVESLKKTQKDLSE